MIIQGDSLTVLKTLESENIHCCITSPPYWGLRDYGHHDQIGLEKTPEEYVEKLVEVFREVKRVLRNDGTLWLNLGDSYAGSMKGEGGTYELSKKQNSNRGSHYGKDNNEKHFFNHGLKPKDLCGIPWRVAFALQADGWWLRQDIIWAKPNPMPESVTDRCTKAHEYVFLLSKSAKYYYDQEAIGSKILDSTVKRYERGWNGNCERGFPDGPQNHIQKFMDSENNKRTWANKKSVWTVNTQPTPEAHFATFPEKLIEPMILAGCPKGGTVLDPFFGSGTTGKVAIKYGRDYIGIELNAKYIDMAKKRVQITPLLVGLL